MDTELFDISNICVRVLQAQLVDNLAESRGVLITSYERARINVDMLLEQGWHYVILDEGHKIRNPEAAVTVALKLVRMSNNLRFIHHKMSGWSSTGSNFEIQREVPVRFSLFCSTGLRIVLFYPGRPCRTISKSCGRCLILYSLANSEP